MSFLISFVKSTENIPRDFKNFGNSFVIENKCCLPGLGSICACIITNLEFFNANFKILWGLKVWSSVRNIPNKSKKELSSPHLKILKRDFEKLLKAEKYLEGERNKLMKEKEKIKNKIKKEKKILKLRNSINFLRGIRKK